MEAKWSSQLGIKATFRAERRKKKGFKKGAASLVHPLVAEKKKFFQKILIIDFFFFLMSCWLKLGHMAIFRDQARGIGLSWLGRPVPGWLAGPLAIVPGVSIRVLWSWGSFQGSLSSFIPDEGRTLLSLEGLFAVLPGVWFHWVWEFALLLAFCPSHSTSDTGVLPNSSLVNRPWQVSLMLSFVSKYNLL